jgi:hypothetical protein
MRFSCLVCLLFASLAFGQAAPPATPPAAGAKAEPNASAMPEKAPEVKVSPDDPVMTLKGFCPDTNLQGDACKTVVTRAQFEKVADALQPNMNPAIRRQAATFYSRMLRMSTEADKRGLNKGPIFDEKMIIARMQILSQELTRALQEDSAKVSDSDIEDYYKKNLANYEEAIFQRIYIPRTKQIVNAALKAAPKTGDAAAAKTPAKPGAPQPPTEAQKKAAEEAMKKLATSIQARAVKGEDPEKLQKEAHVAAGLPGNAPISKMENTRRNTLPPNHQAVMDLKVGEVSEVIADPNGGYFVYKMISKETLPLDDKVKAEIKNLISSQRYRDSMQAFQGPTTLDLNDAYFGAARPAMLPPSPRPVRPTPQQSADPD